MTLGYCILHANRIDAALDGMREDAIAGDEAIDLGLGVFALRDPGQLVNGYLEGVMAEFRAVITRVEQAFAGGNGVLGDLQRWIRELGQVRFEDLRLTPWVDRLADLFTALEPIALAGRLDALLERIAIAFPELTGGGLLDRFVAIALGGLDVLERRRLDGQDDLAAHRAFRMARIIRCWLGEALAGLRERVASFDLLAMVRGALRELFGSITGPGSDMLREVAEQVRTKIRPFAVAVDALLGLRVSVQVNASVQTLPEPGHLWLDDNLTVPHDVSHPLWWLDLGSAVNSLVFTIIDVSRFNPFQGQRTWDAIASVLNLAWQVVRGAVRAARPDFLQRNHSNTIGAFWFGELGDFCIQTFLNLVTSLIYEAPAAGSNWVMSFACRLARWYTFTLQPRLPYIFGRAIWYLRAWKEQGWVREHVVAAGETIESIAAAAQVDPIRLRIWNRIAEGGQPKVGDTLRIAVEPGTAGAKRAKFSAARHAWNTWMWMWLVSVFNGALQGWDDMQVDKLGETRFAKLGIWLGPVLGLLAAILLPMAIGEGFATVDYEVDPAVLTALIVMWLLLIGMICGSMYSANVTRDKWWIFLIIALPVCLVLFIPVIAVWADPTANQEIAGGFLYTTTLLEGIIIFGVLTTILWWMYIDDGRDKQGAFNHLDVATTPYKLPWDKDDVWICGQGFHGIFSHYLRENAGNHYGYDFLEGKDKPALAARDGWVVSIHQRSPYGSPEQNDVAILHSNWAAGHDPGRELERVQTGSHYIHIGPNCARMDIDQRIIQGQNIVDIDSTGISAQQHLHFGAADLAHARWWDQGHATFGRNTRITHLFSTSRPTIFADESLRRDRTNPILRLIPGHIHHKGRPLAQCLYKSDNQRRTGPARPLILTTQVHTVGGITHSHTLRIDVASLPLDGNLGATLHLKTSVDAGHRHDVDITAAQLVELLRHALPANWTTAAALADSLAHSHAFQPEPFAGGGAERADSPIAQVGVTAPPPAQLVATVGGPYDLLDKQIVLRVDDRHSEMFRFGGDRARLIADLALDRAPRNSDSIAVTQSGPGGAGLAVSTNAGRHSVVSGAGQLDVALGQVLPITIRAVPVLVLETRSRSAASSIEILPASTALAALGIDPAGVQARGSGAGPGRSMTHDQLRDLFRLELNGPPPPPPPPPAPAPAPPPAPHAPAAADVHATAAAAPSNAIDLDIGGIAVTFDGQTRAKTILTRLYDVPTKEIRGDGSLPLGCGRILLTKTGTVEQFEVPITGTPAAVQLVPATAHLTGAALAGSPLLIAVGNSEVAVRLPAAATLADIATRIMREVEGVRAWEQDGKLSIETLAVGPGVTLRVRKVGPGGGTPFVTNATGQAPGLQGGASIDDSSAITRAELIRLIGDAATLAERRAAVAAGTKVTVTVDRVGNHLRLQVPVGKTIELLRPSSSQALVAALATDSPPATPGRELELREIANINLPVGGWLDFQVDGELRRVHIDPEPAQLELPPPTRWPAAGEFLRISVNGAAHVDVDVGARDSLVAIADAIVAAHPTLAVRIAHRLTVEARTIGSVAMSLGVGREAFGFLAPAAATADPGPADLRAVVENNAFAMARSAVEGAVTAGTWTSSATVGTGPTAGQHRVELHGHSNRQVKVTVDLGGVVDPFGLVQPNPLATIQGAYFATKPLPKRAFGYTIALSDPGTPDVSGRSHVLLSASPAELRAVRAIGVLPLVGTVNLRIALTMPGRNVTADFALGGLSELARGEQGVTVADQVDLGLQLIDRIQRELPMLDAWLLADANVPSLLCLQTRGAGTGWRIRLEGETALVALGFDPAKIVGGAIDATGGGDFVDEQHVTAAEVATAFAKAIPWTTFGQNAKYRVSHSGGIVTVEADGTPAPAITVRTEPASLLPELHSRTNGAKLEFDVRRPLDLGGGQIILERGGQAAAVVFVQGQRGRVVAPQPLPATGSADETSELNLLKHLNANDVTVTIDTVHATALRSIPAGVTSLEAAVVELAKQVPAARFTIAAGRQLRVESRTRGSASKVELRFAAGLFARTHGSLLGFTANITGTGDGRFPDLGKVQAADLVAALNDVRDEAIVAQNLMTSEFNATTNVARLRTSDPSANLIHTHPIQLLNGTNLHFAPGFSPVVDLNWPAPAALVSTVARVLWRQTAAIGGTSVERRVHVPLWGGPAQLQFKVAASSPSAFGSRRLALTLQTRNFDVDFVNPRTWAEVGRQIEAASGGELFARVFERPTVDPAGTERILELASVMEGTEARLVLRVASGASDARERLSGLAAGPIEARGRGSVPRMDRVDGPALAAAFGHSWTSEESGLLPSDIDMPTAWRSRYDAKADAPVLRVRSRRLGCMSTVTGEHGHAAFAFERSLQRGPAVRAAAVIPPGGPVVLASPATLAIVFDDNGTGPDVAPPRRVTVEMAAKTWQRDELAAHIHAAVFGPGVGMAGAFPDGSIVVETMTWGLAGSVTLPADGSSGLGPLGLGVTQTRRGWAGSGVFESHEGFRTAANLSPIAPAAPGTVNQANTPYVPVRGWRAAHRQPSAGIEWVFRDGPPNMPGVFSSPRLTLQAGWSPEQLVNEVDRALASATRPPPTGGGPTTQRIGFAKLGSDNALHIETRSRVLMLEVKPSSGAVCVLGHPDGPDPTDLPAVGTIWRFRNGAPTMPGVFTTPSVTMQAGWNHRRWATEMNDALGRATNGTTTRRIGDAVVHQVDSGGGTMVDRIRLVGSGGDPLFIEIPPPTSGSGPIGCEPLPGLGERVDIKAEPGVDLRATDTLRTYRLVYDRKGAAQTSSAGDFVDVGWLRPRTDPLWGTTRDNRTGEPLDVPAWPRGRYLLAARAEAAIHDYASPGYGGVGGAGEMIESFGNATVDGTAIHFIRVARYFVGLTCLTDWNLQAIMGEAGLPRRRAQPHLPLMMGVRFFDGQVMVDWLV
jgi:hypothetical protein